MEFITINKQHNDISHQLEFLIRKEFYIKYTKYRRYPLYILVWTVAFFSLLLFTSSDSLITLKAVSSLLTAILWIVSFLVFAGLTVKFLKRRMWKRKCVKAELLDTAKYQMAFDNEKLYFIADTYNSEFLWEHYTFYSKEKTHLFLFPADNIYHATCVSQSEIGADYFDQLVIIAESKLPHL